MRREAVLGYLVGTAIDPLTWLTAFVVAYVLRSKPWYLRVLVAVLVVGAIAVAIAITLRPGEPLTFRTFSMTMIATGLWSLIAVGVARVRSAM